MTAPQWSIRLCDRERGMSARRDGQVIVGWRVRVTLGGRRYQMPVPDENQPLDYFEFELHATDTYNEFAKIPGADAELIPVWGTVSQVASRPDSPRCHFHSLTRAIGMILLGDEPIFACRACADRWVPLGAEVLA